jgi:hypothetical protein
MVIIVSNVILFILTTRRLIQINRETKMSRCGESQRHLATNKHRFWLYLRLFVAMGIIWFLEALSYWLRESQNCILMWTTVLGDGILSFFGVIIFYLFVCNSKIKRMATTR